MFSTGSRYAITGSSNGCVFIYDLYTGETVSSVRVHGNVIRDVSWHPYKPLIVTSSFDGKHGLLKPPSG